MAFFFTNLIHPTSKDEVRFLVTGTSGDYNVTIKDPAGHASQQLIASKGYQQSFTAHKGDYVYLSAQANRKSAEVHVKILYHGKMFREATSTGDYALAQTGGCLC